MTRETAAWRVAKLLKQKEKNIEISTTTLLMLYTHQKLAMNF